VQQATRGILNSLFPSWLPGAFKVRTGGLWLWLGLVSTTALCLDCVDWRARGALRAAKLLAHTALIAAQMALPQVMFSGPLPDFSCRLSALATAATCQWLMGPCTVNDVELDDGRVRPSAAQQPCSAISS
jgi:hypothetical protein